MMVEMLGRARREAVTSYREIAVETSNLRTSLLIQDPTPVLHILRVMNETHPTLMLYAAGMVAVTAGTYLIEELRDPIFRAASSALRRRSS